MRQYAVLRNVVRDVNFGVVVKSEGTIKFFGWSEKAVEWANWANANNADLNQLPPNISIGEFKGMSDEMMKNIILSSEEATAAGSSTIKTKTLSFNVGGERHQHSSKFPSFVDSPIASDWMAKKKSINFKALNFKKEVALSEISLGMRSHELAFNNETKQFVAKPNKITATYSRSKIQKKISRSAERKFGKQIIEYANKEISKNFVAPTIKRDSMGKFTKEILDVYTKAKLGRAIGRAVGSAARGITPNRRTRGVASRFISGVLDPMKRRDVDGDGMIFDGTWREMPDPNRFAKVPDKPSSSGTGLSGPRGNGKLNLPNGGGGFGIRTPQKPDSRRGADRTLRSSGRGGGKPEAQDPKKPSIDIMRRNRDTIRESFRRAQGLSPEDGAPREGLRSSGSRTSQPETPRRDLGPVPTNVRSFIKRLKDKYSNPIRSDDSELTDNLRRRIAEQEAAGLRRESSLQPLFREWENGFISDRNREAALDFLRDIENQYQKQDNQSPSVTTRPVSQEDRIAAAHLAKLIAMSDDDYREERFNPIRGIDYSPIEKFRQERIERDREFNREFDRQNPSLARRGEGLRSRGGRRERVDMTDMTPEEREANRPSNVSEEEYRRRTLRDADRMIDEGGLRSSGSTAEAQDDAGRYDDMPSIESAVTKLTAGERMSVDELDYLNEVVNKILNNPDTPENVRDAMLDLKNSISKRRKGGDDNRGLRSSGRPSVPKEELLDIIRGPIGDMIRGEIGDREAVGLKPKPSNPEKNKDGSLVNPFDREETESLFGRLGFYNKSIKQLEKWLDGDGPFPTGLDDWYRDRDRANKLLRGYREERRDALKSLKDRGYESPNEARVEYNRSKKKPARRPARDGELTPLQPYMGELPRRGLSRSGQRVDTPLSTRRSLATTQRAASPRGTTLRSSSSGGDGKTRTPVERTASRGTGAGPGGKAGHNRMKTTYGKTKKGDDGKVFDSLTPEQQAAIKKELTETVKPALDKKLKTFFSKYWAARTQKGSKKQSVVAVKRRAKGDSRGRYEKVSADTPLESDDIYEMLYRLDGQVADGLVEKFEVSDKDSRELKLDEDGNAKVSATKNGYTNQQRTLDDTQTVLNMIEADDFSALEHLHPSTKKKIADVIKKNGGEVPKGWIDSESSVAGWAGGEGRTKAPDVIDLEKERGIGKKKKDKRPPLFQRLRRVDPEREKRIELRAARRQGRVREGISLDPELELKRRKLRARAMKRTFMSRFRKNRDPEELSTDMKARKDEVSIVKTNTSNGTVEITDGFVDLLNALDQGLIGINEQKKGRKLTEQQIESEYQTLLRRLWENSGYSETPIQLKEDEVKSLLDAGWQPIIRGTGGEKINSETYVEQFITSEGRFIPGQGGSAYGIGEYFAYPGQWDGYAGGPNDRHTIIALIPPSADMMTRSEISREHGNLKNITTRIGTAFKVFGGRDATKAMTAEELVSEIDKAVPDLASDRSRTGQIVKQLRDRLEVVSKLPQNDEASRNDANDQKTKILNSLDYLERFSKQQAEMIAPLIGVDAIDTNEGDGMDSPVLLHNRTNVAVFQVPTTRDQAKAMVSDPNGQGRPKAWTKWKRTLADVKDRESAPTRRRRSRTGSAVKPQPAAPTPAAPTPATPTPAAPTPSAPNSQGTKAPVDVSSWTSSRPQSTGSNPATLLTAPDGTQYYTKLPKGTPDDKDRMETESLASELYKLAGIQSADVQMGTRNGQPVTLSRMVQSRMPNSQADQDEALKGYVVDAWLANWDAPLNDNIKIDSNGNAVRLDVGGSLDFRAQGARKGQAWGNTVGEIDSMKKGGTYDYNKITDAAIKQQAKALGNVTDADIRATVSRIVSDPARAKALADTLIARRDDIVKRYGQ
jgi:hypothetical protein